MTNPLDAVRAQSAYLRTSRYSGIGTAVFTAPDGRQVPYLRRRLLPRLDSVAAFVAHVVASGERPDVLAFRFLGDPEQQWRLADANPVFDPGELTAVPGTRIRIPLPVWAARRGREARVVDPTPTHLTLLMGSQIAVLAPQAVTDALLSAQVTVTAGQRSGFQLGFDLAKNGLLNTTLLPNGFFDPKTRVVIVVTVAGTPTVLMDGVIVRQEVAVSNQPGQSTLTVTGEDLTVLMDLEERAGDNFPAMPHAGQVAVILSRYAHYGITPLVIPEIFPSTPMPTQRIDFQKGTDLGYLTELAKANGYVFYLDPGPLPGTSRAYWGPEVRLGVPQHALNVNMDGLSTVDQLTFGFDGSAREEPQARVQIPATHVSAVLPVPEVSVLRPPLAVRPAPALKKTVLSDTAKKDPAQALAAALPRPRSPRMRSAVGAARRAAVRVPCCARANWLVSAEPASPTTAVTT